MRSFHFTPISLIIALSVGGAVHAGSLNYQKWDVAACIEPDYVAASENRDYAIALADSIRYVASDVLQLTHLEEHLSLVKARSNNSTADSLRAQAEITLNRVFSNILNVKSNLSQVKQTEAVILADIASDDFPEDLQRLLGDTSSQAGDSASATLLSRYDLAIGDLEVAARAAQKGMNNLSREAAINSEEQRTFSDTMAELARKTFSLLSVAEAISAETAAEGREQMNVAGIENCSPGME